MRFTRIIPLLATIAAATAPLAAQSFEGRIWFVNIKDDGRVDTAVQISKPGYFRIDGAMGGHGGGVIVDLKARTYTALIPEQKMYMTRPFPTPRPGADSAMGTFTLNETGRTETIAGVTCRVYEGTRTTKDKVEKGEACLAKGIGLQFGDVLAMMASGQQRGSFYSALQRLREQDLHVMKMVGFKDGKAENTMVAIKVERGSVPQSEFQPPSDYTGMQMPNMPMKTPN